MQWIDFTLITGMHVNWLCLQIFMMLWIHTCLPGWWNPIQQIGENESKIWFDSMRSLFVSECLAFSQNIDFKTPLLWEKLAVCLRQSVSCISIHGSFSYSVIWPHGQYNFTGKHFLYKIFPFSDSFIWSNYINWGLSDFKRWI